MGLYSRFYGIRIHCCEYRTSKCNKVGKSARMALSNVYPFESKIYSRGFYVKLEVKTSKISKKVDLYGCGIHANNESKHVYYFIKLGSSISDIFLSTK